MNSKYDFYEITVIKSNKPHLIKFNGLEAVIMGKSQHEDDPSIWAYSVDIEGIDENYCIYEEDLCPTDKKAKEEDFYTGETVKIRVDPETGEGILVDDDE